MRKYYVILLILFLVVQVKINAQPLTRNFSYQLNNANIIASTTLSNGDLVTYGAAYPDLNTHPVYSTNLPDIPGTYYLSRYSPRGLLKWFSPVYAPYHITLAKIAADANDNVYLSGMFVDTIVFNPGGVPQSVFTMNYAYDIVFAKFDSSGTFQWVHTIGGMGSEWYGGLNVLPGGNIGITGQFANTVDFDPGPAAVSFTSTGLNKSAFIAQYDPSGNFVNVIPYLTSGTMSIMVREVKCDLSNNIYIYGSFRDTVDFDPGPGVFNLYSPNSEGAFIVKYNSAWQVTWGHVLGNLIGIQQIIFDNSDNLVVSGNHEATADFDISGGTTSLGYEGIYIARYDSALSITSVVGIDPDNNVNVYYTDLETDLQNNIIATGYFDGVIDVDPGTGVQNLDVYWNGSNYDSFLIRYDNQNQLQSVDQFTDAGTQRIDQLMIHGDRLWLAGVFEFSIDVELGPGTFLHSKANGGENALMANYYLCIPSYNTISHTMCHGDHFVFANDTLTDEGRYTRYFTNATGCDSIVVLDLDVNFVNNGITLRDSVFYCDAVTAQYQWYNCTTQSNVPGATGNTYQALDYDEYAALVTENGCTGKTPCMMRYENVNTSLPELNWAYLTNLDIFMDYSENHMSTDYDQNLVVGGGFDETWDFDWTGGEAYINPHEHDDMAVATYRPDGTFKTAFASGNYGSTTEGAFSTLNDSQNNTITIGKSQAYDFDPDTGIVMLPAGTTTFMAKINESSQLLWAVGLPGIFNIKSSAIADDGSYIVCGIFNNTFDIDPGPAVFNLPCNPTTDNSFVAKFSATGQLITAFSIYSNVSGADVLIESSAIDRAGNILIGGTYTETTDFDPGPAVFNMTSPNNPDAFVVKYSPTGQFLWAKNKPYAFGNLTCDYDNNIFAGYSGSQVIEKYNSSGTLLATRPIQPFNLDFHQLQSDNTGDLNILCAFTGTLVLGGNTFSSLSSYRTLIGRFDNDLNYKWAFMLNCSPSELRVDDEQNVYFYGRLDLGACDVDPGPDSLILNSGFPYTFVARYGYSCVSPTSISGNTALCQGNSTVLNAGPGYSSYAWSTGATTQTISVSQAGLYYVDVTSNLGCVYRDSVTITVNPIPVPFITAATNTNICQGDSVQLNATPGYSNYQWQRNFVDLTGMVSDDYYAKSTGKYRCVVTDAGCTGISNQITVRVVCISPGPNHQKTYNEENDVELEVTAVPNPATKEFRIISNCDDFSKTNLIIYDSSSREIRRFSNHKNNDEFLVEGLAPGMYYGKLTCDLGTKIVKIIVPGSSTE